MKYTENLGLNFFKYNYVKVTHVKLLIYLKFNSTTYTFWQFRDFELTDNNFNIENLMFAL